MANTEKALRREKSSRSVPSLTKDQARTRINHFKVYLDTGATIPSWVCTSTKNHGDFSQERALIEDAMTSEERSSIGFKVRSHANPPVHMLYLVKR